MLDQLGKDSLAKVHGPLSLPDEMPQKWSFSIQSNSNRSRLQLLQALHGQWIAGGSQLFPGHQCSILSRTKPEICASKQFISNYLQTRKISCTQVVPL